MPLQELLQLLETVVQTAKPPIVLGRAKKGSGLYALEYKHRLADACGVIIRRFYVTSLRRNFFEVP
jgi:hypothetical protein